MRGLRKTGVIFDRIIVGLAWAAGVLLAFAAIAVSVDVVLRYFFNRPIAWVLEISEYILLYVTFMAAAWVLKDEGHIRVDLLVNHLNSRIQALILIVTSVIGAFVMLILTWFGGRVTLDFYRRGVPTLEYLKTPEYLVLIIIPIGSFFLGIQFLRRAHKYLKSRHQKKAERVVGS